MLRPQTAQVAIAVHGHDGPVLPANDLDALEVREIDSANLAVGHLFTPDDINAGPAGAYQSAIFENMLHRLHGDPAAVHSLDRVVSHKELLPGFSVNCRILSHGAPPFDWQDRFNRL